MRGTPAVTAPPAARSRDARPEPERPRRGAASPTWRRAIHSTKGWPRCAASRRSWPASGGRWRRWIRSGRSPPMTRRRSWAGCWAGHGSATPSCGRWRRKRSRWRYRDGLSSLRRRTIGVAGHFTRGNPACRWARNQSRSGAAGPPLLAAPPRSGRSGTLAHGRHAARHLFVRAGCRGLPLHRLASPPDWERGWLGGLPDLSHPVCGPSGEPAYGEGTRRTTRALAPTATLTRPGRVSSATNDRP